MGIVAGVASIVAAVLPESLAFAAPIIAGGLVGAGGGALFGEITGGDPGQGALFGGLTGGLAGGAGELFSAATAPASDTAAATAGGAASAGGPVGSVAASTPVDLTSAAAGAGAPTSAFATDVGSSTVSGLSGAAAGAGDLGTAVDAAATLGQAVPAASTAGGDASTVLQSLGGGVAAAPGGVFDASGQLAGVSSDVAGATASGGATGLSQAPLSAANIAGGAGAPQSFLDKILSGAGSSISKNPVGTALAGAGLVKDLATQKQDPNAKALANQASALNAQISQLEAPLTSGQLPPGAQAAVNQGVAAAEAQIRAKYASLGLSGSTMETQDLANIDMQRKTEVFQLAGQLFNQGIQGAQLSEQIYKDLLGANQAQNQQTGQAIANLSAALSGGGSVSGKGITLNLPGATAP